MAKDGGGLSRAMLGTGGQAQDRARSGTPQAMHPANRNASRRQDPQETLALIEDAGAAFEALQFKLLAIVQNARGLIEEAAQERALHRDQVEALEQEKQAWSVRARKAEDSLNQAGELLQMQQRMVEEAITREREALQRCRRLELKLSQLSF